MISVKEVIVVEGRYDKNTLKQIFDAVILETAGFHIYTDKDLLTLLRTFAQTRGIIIFTDSDHAGFQIRNYLKGAISRGRVLHAYVPDVEGKERRKRSPSKEGKLGVEGMSPSILIEALRRSGATLSQDQVQRQGEKIQKSDLFACGLLGGTDSGGKRKKLLKKLELPEHLTGNGFLDVLNALMNKQEFLDMTVSMEIEM